MRSVFASLALALAPRLLTYTQTLAPRPPHALADSRLPASPPSAPKPAPAPGIAALPASPTRARTAPRAPRPPPAWLLPVGAHPSALDSATRSESSLETGFSFPATLPTLLFPGAQRVGL
uniref:Classical arabinogalactan protein 4-like n=1 Tax=Castor canadensis TaxID=51338 RepID=A0A8B7TTV1_CASCN|nr:classical arabinogalactan protein 4-like [Castor canadensis]